jgi:hypothetical protein
MDPAIKAVAKTVAKTVAKAVVNIQGSVSTAEGVVD